MHPQIKVMGILEKINKSSVDVEAVIMLMKSY